MAICFINEIRKWNNVLFFFSCHEDQKSQFKLLSEHWQNDEAHFNDQLCLKFVISLIIETDGVPFVQLSIFIFLSFCHKKCTFFTLKII